jgi:hypothetical protein
VDFFNIYSAVNSRLMIQRYIVLLHKTMIWGNLDFGVTTLINQIEPSQILYHYDSKAPSVLKRIFKESALPLKRLPGIFGVFH